MTWQPRLLTTLFSDDDADKLNQDLAYIYKNTSVPMQQELLASRARELYNQKDWIPARGVRRKLVLEVVADLRKQIHEFVPVGAKDEPNLANHDRYCEFLRQGAAKLNAELNRPSKQSAKDEAEEANAIEEDRKQIAEAIEMAKAKTTRAPTPTLKDILVFKMERPDEEPLTIPGRLGYTKYNKIMVHISRMGFVLSPEVWVRLEKEHDLTAMGYKWKYRHCGQPVELDTSEKPFILDVVDMKGRGDYIVALVHGGTQAKEAAFALDLPRLGDRACCNPPCGNLGNHLKCIWPNRVVVDAKRFSQPENPDVLSTALENTLYEARTNDLYLLWTPATASAQPVVQPVQSIPHGRLESITFPLDFVWSIRFPTDLIVTGYRLLYGFCFYIVHLVGPAGSRAVG